MISLNNKKKLKVEKRRKERKKRFCSYPTPSSNNHSYEQFILLTKPPFSVQHKKEFFS